MYLDNNQLIICEDMAKQKSYIKEILATEKYNPTTCVSITSEIDLYFCVYPNQWDYQIVYGYVVFNGTGLIIGKFNTLKQSHFPYPQIRSIGLDKKWRRKGI